VVLSRIYETLCGPPEIPGEPPMFHLDKGVRKGLGWG